MRITVTHGKTQQEATKDVEDAVSRLATTKIPGPISISNVERAWNGSLMKVSLLAAAGPFRSPIRGTVLVTEQDITIECTLPALLTRIVPGRAIQAAVESQVRGLLK